MNEIAKGTLLFIFNWVLFIIFSVSPIISSVGNFLQNLLKTLRIERLDSFVGLLLVILTSYFLNSWFIKAKTVTFISSQILFVITVIGVSARALMQYF